MNIKFFKNQKCILFFITSFILILIAGYCLITSSWFLCHYLLPIIEKQTHCQINAQSIDLSFFNSKIHIKNLKINTLDQAHSVNIRSYSSDFDLKNLILKQISFSNIQINQLSWEINQDSLISKIDLQKNTNNSLSISSTFDTDLFFNLQNIHINDASINVLHKNNHLIKIHHLNATIDQIKNNQNTHIQLQGHCAVNNDQSIAIQDSLLELNGDIHLSQNIIPKHFNLIQKISNISGKINQIDLKKVTSEIQIQGDISSQNIIHLKKFTLIEKKENKTNSLINLAGNFDFFLKNAELQIDCEPISPELIDFMGSFFKFGNFGNTQVSYHGKILLKEQLISAKGKFAAANFEYQHPQMSIPVIKNMNIEFTHDFRFLTQNLTLINNRCNFYCSIGNNRTISIINSHPFELCFDKTKPLFQDKMPELYVIIKKFPLQILKMFFPQSPWLPIEGSTSARFILSAINLDSIKIKGLSEIHNAIFTPNEHFCFSDASCLIPFDGIINADGTSNVNFGPCTLNERGQELAIFQMQLNHSRKEKLIKSKIQLAMHPSQLISHVQFLNTTKYPIIANLCELQPDLLNINLETSAQYDTQIYQIQDLSIGLKKGMATLAKLNVHGKLNWRNQNWTLFIDQFIASPSIPLKIIPDIDYDYHQKIAKFLENKQITFISKFSGILNQSQVNISDSIFTIEMPDPLLPQNNSISIQQMKPISINNQNISDIYTSIIVKNCPLREAAFFVDQPIYNQICQAFPSPNDVISIETETILSLQNMILKIPTANVSIIQKEPIINANLNLPMIIPLNAKNKEKCILEASLKINNLNTLTAYPFFKEYVPVTINSGINHANFTINYNITENYLMTKGVVNTQNLNLCSPHFSKKDLSFDLSGKWILDFEKGSITNEPLEILIFSDSNQQKNKILEFSSNFNFNWNWGNGEINYKIHFLNKDFIDNLALFIDQNSSWIQDLNLSGDGLISFNQFNVQHVLANFLGDQFTLKFSDDTPSSPLSFTVNFELIPQDSHFLLKLCEFELFTQLKKPILNFFVNGKLFNSNLPITSQLEIQSSLIDIPQLLKAIPISKKENTQINIEQDSPYTEGIGLDEDISPIDLGDLNVAIHLKIPKIIINDQNNISITGDIKYKQNQLIIPDLLIQQDLQKFSCKGNANLNSPEGITYQFMVHSDQFDLTPYGKLNAYLNNVDPFFGILKNLKLIVHGQGFSVKNLTKNLSAELFCQLEKIEIPIQPQSIWLKILMVPIQLLHINETNHHQLEYNNQTISTIAFNKGKIHINVKKGIAYLNTFEFNESALISDINLNDGTIQLSNSEINIPVRINLQSMVILLGKEVGKIWDPHFSLVQSIGGTVFENLKNILDPFLLSRILQLNKEEQEKKEKQNIEKHFKKYIPLQK